MGTGKTHCACLIGMHLNFILRTEFYSKEI